MYSTYAIEWLGRLNYRISSTIPGFPLLQLDRGRMTQGVRVSIAKPTSLQNIRSLYFDNGFCKKKQKIGALQGQN